jgi:hypothetical protein
VQHAHHGLLLKPHDDAIGHRDHRRQAQRLAGQAAFAEEVSAPMEGDNRLLALLGYDADLTLPSWT